MAVIAVYSSNGGLSETLSKPLPFASKEKLAKMLEGGVIVEVGTPKQARDAQKAGALAVVIMRVPADTGAQGGIAYLDAGTILAVKAAVTIPVMVKVRKGHFVEAENAHTVGINFFDESEELSPVDERYIEKEGFKVPFANGCHDLGEALRRMSEGTLIIYTKGRSPHEAVDHLRAIKQGIHLLLKMDDDKVRDYTKETHASFELVLKTKQQGRLPVLQFAAGGIVTSDDAALMMRHGCDGVFVSSEIFKREDPKLVISAIVRAVKNYKDREEVAKCWMSESRSKTPRSRGWLPALRGWLRTVSRKIHCALGVVEWIAAPFTVKQTAQSFP